ncbi:hypothetical protein CEB3_c19190 [Peptococcaceae bacterium CEB3]|nr:hypothetical protein CEB3_c19190 [Peptococcaceae bacterium CEB3]
MDNSFFTQLANFIQNTLIAGIGVIGLILCLGGVLVGAIKRKWQLVGGAVVGGLIISAAMPQNSWLNIGHISWPSLVANGSANAPTWVRVLIGMVLFAGMIDAFAQLIAAPLKPKKQK